MGLLKAAATVVVLGGFAAKRWALGPPPPPTASAVSQSEIRRWLAAEEAPAPAKRASLLVRLWEHSESLNTTCGLEVQERYHCSEPGCEDLVPGYINYIYFQECIVNTEAARIGSGMLLVLWMLFLLHMVETTTNDYFCTSLQLVVAILKLSPNVAGVTFLAVGNAACDVIASIAAFATGVPKVGVGTTLGAGIFVTTAVVAAVSFVADVRLARRSFVRDILFFIGTVVYLLYTTLDGIITVGEAAGFMIIYVVFVAVVAGGRYIRSLRTEDEGHSFGGSTGKEHVEGGEGSGSGTGSGGATPALTDGSSYQAPDTTASPSSKGEDDPEERRRKGLLSALESARREAMSAKHDREIESLKREKTFSSVARPEGGGFSFAPPARSATTAALPTIRPGGLEFNRPLSASNASTGTDGDDGEEGDGDLGGGMGGSSPGGTFIPGREGSGSRNRSKSITSGLARSVSVLEDLPTKPSAWTSAFNATQEGGSGSGSGSGGGTPSSSKKGKGGKGGAKRYEAYAMPSYHKRKLAKEMAARLAERGIHHMVTTEDGRTVDIAELAVTDPDAAAAILSKAASAITATAVKAGGALSFQDAAAVVNESSGLLGAAGPGGGGAGGSVGPNGSTVAVDVSADLLAVLPKETIKPVADMYFRFKRVFGAVGPYYSAMMHTAEKPVVVARHLTIPLLHPGAYHRRMVILNMPFAFALFAFVFTSHIIKGTDMVGGFPTVVIAGIFGAALAGVLAWTLPTKGSMRKMSSSALLDKSGGAAGSASAVEAAADSALAKVEGGKAGGEEGGHHSHWYSPVVSRLMGPTDEPLPTGPIFGFFLLLSFVMSLFWLLLIANELVGTALCFGKVLAIPDTVMGLVVLAIGNSINDLAASVTIAREGFPTMAVAGAYAGPMFNVLAGIGLPMLIYTSKGGDYAIGQDTPLVQAAFATLLGSLTVTLIWVPLAGFRITHRIGRFLMVWFALFILLVIIMGSIPGLTGEGDVALSE